MSKFYLLVSLDKVIKLDLDQVPVDPTTTYKMVGVYSFGKGLFRKESVKGINTSYRYFFRLKADHVVMSQLFGWEGALALSSSEFEGLFVSSQFPTFVCDETRLDRYFLRWLMKRPSFWEDLGTRAKGMGDRRLTLNPDSLLQSIIPLPPIEEQRSLVARIEELAGKIEEARSLRKQALQETDILVKSFARKLFEDHLESSITIEKLVGRANLKNGKSIRITEQFSEIKCIRLSAMRDGQIDCTDAKPVPMSKEEAEQYLVKLGDVFVVRGNGSKDLVGKAGIVKNSVEGTIFPDLFIRVPLDHHHILPSFFVAWWNNPLMRDKIKDAAKTTSGIWKINQGHIASFSIPLPPLLEQRRIVAYLDELQAKVEAMKRLRENAIAELDALLPSILDKAFKGEL